MYKVPPVGETLYEKRKVKNEKHPRAAEVFACKDIKILK